MFTASKNSIALIVLFLVTAIFTAASTTNMTVSSSAVSSATYSMTSNTTQTIMVSANSTTTIPANSTVTKVTNSTIPSVNVTIDSYPEGASLITVDGNRIITPMLFLWPVGSTHTLSSVSSIDCDASCQWVFQYWTDGYGQTHTITVSNSTTTYLAVYQQEGMVPSFSATTTSTTSSTTFSTPAPPTPPQNLDFALTVAPSAVYLPPDVFAGSTGFTLTLTSISGWRGNVQFNTSQLPAGVTLSYMPSTYSLDTPFASWNVEVNIIAPVQAGSYPIEITATSGSLTYAASVTVEVQGATVGSAG
jgi:hypothetical protein